MGTYMLLHTVTCIQNDIPSFG